ncbi:MAG: Fe-S cluster assembly protein SufD [Muribaculaceae bacterium]|nr:Fe-S cluster assembly protein SufD [Muribaculaceae bacterium]
MNPLKQYLDLYRENRETIEQSSTPVLNALRTNALTVLEKEGSRLPGKCDEGYEKTAVDEMFAPDYGVNINGVKLPVDPSLTFKCDVPSVSTLLALVVGDTFIPTRTLLNNLPAGVTVTSLADASRTMPETVEKFLGKIANEDEAGVALNSLLVRDGLMVHVAEGVKAEKPIQIVNIFNTPVPTMAVRRVLVVAEENSSVKLLFCDHTQRDDTDYLDSQVIEVAVEAGAEVDICDIEESSPRTHRFSQLFTKQGNDSKLKVTGVTLVNGETRNNFTVKVEGNGCDTRLDGMAIGKASQSIDNRTYLLHASDHCSSNQLFKYVLDDSSRGAFEGLIEVAKGARFNEAYQSNRNILASKAARMHTKPQLLIYNDDVKCSHGATTGQLDERAIFYMQQRGIPQNEARTMLMQAFMVDIIEKVSIEGLSDRLRHLVERRFRGEDALCGDCSASCTPVTKKDNL